MTKRPTTTTARSANFQASNALPPLLRMQLPRSVAGQPLQSCGIVPKRRKVPPHLGLPLLQRLRQSPDCPSRFFVSSPQTYRPLRRFCRRGAAITVGTVTATAQQAQRNNPFGSSPSRCPRCEQPRPKTTPRRPSIAKPTRSAAGKRGGIGRKHTHFFEIIRNFFEPVPVHSPMRPDNAHDQSAPQRLCGRKHHPLSRFLPTDLHLWPFLPIFAPIHVRKTSHPPSSSGLGLDSSPRPAAAIGGENLSLP